MSFHVILDVFLLVNNIVSKLVSNRNIRKEIYTLSPNLATIFEISQQKQMCYFFADLYLALLHCTDLAVKQSCNEKYFLYHTICVLLTLDAMAPSASASISFDIFSPVFTGTLISPPLPWPHHLDMMISHFPSCFN